MPAGLCPGAYVSIFRWMSGLRFGADYPWVKEKEKVLTRCTDGFRPVVLRLEKTEDWANGTPRICLPHRWPPGSRKYLNKNSTIGTMDLYGHFLPVLAVALTPA